MKVRRSIKPDKLEELYTKEKRKLEVQMLREYDLDRINLKILEHSPPRDLMKPRYRYLEIANKF